jgi:hypothetical protein
MTFGLLLLQRSMLKMSGDVGGGKSCGGGVGDGGEFHCDGQWHW